MNDGTLYRASTELDVTGRTLEGLAVPWERWAMVADMGGRPYPEAHARSNFDESLRRDPGTRPLYSTHEWVFDPTADPIGAVHFERSNEGLVFRAFVSKTRKGMEQLELVRDGAKRSVSVGFRPLRSERVQRPEGTGQRRMESKLTELSVVPTGLGQYEDARVLALRASLDPSFSDISEAVSDVLKSTFATDTSYVYLCDIGDGWAVYEVQAADDSAEAGPYRVTYAVDDTGAASVESEPERVERQWVPIGDEAQRSDTSDEKARQFTPSATPNLDRWRRQRAKLGPRL